jgi:tetratricopeptide (TPR) repeat protein
MEMGDWDEAYRVMEECSRNIPHWPFLHYFMGFIDILKGEGEKALEKAREIETPELAAYSHVFQGRYSPHFQALQAKFQADSGDHAAAIRSYNTTCNEVGRANWNYGGDTLLYFLNCSQVNYNLGRTYEAMGDEPRAIEYYEQALDQWKDADADLPELIDTKNRLSSLKRPESE